MALTFEIQPQDSAHFPQTSCICIATSFAKVFPQLNQKNYSVEVELVSNAAIQVLNQTHRQKNKPTDVLSFPLFVRPEDWQTIATPEAILGTVVISLEYAEAHHTPVLELLFHGTLHLLGFDHETDETTWLHQEYAIIQEMAQCGLIIQGIPHN